MCLNGETTSTNAKKSNESNESSNNAGEVIYDKFAIEAKDDLDNDSDQPEKCCDPF